MSNIFVPPGQSAANNRTQSQANVAQSGSNLLSVITPGLTQNLQYANSQAPAYDNAITNAEQQLSPGNDAATLQRLSNAAYSNAGQAARNADQMDKSEGLSDAYASGQNTAINNEAAQQVGQDEAQMDSPEYHLQQAQGLLGVMNQGANSPLQGDYSNLVSQIYGQPQVPVGEGFGQVLGSIAGSALGSGDFFSSQGNSGNNNQGSSYSPEQLNLAASAPSFAQGLSL
jgi:hypothetical protein